MSTTKNSTVTIVFRTTQPLVHVLNNHDLSGASGDFLPEQGSLGYTMTTIMGLRESSWWQQLKATLWSRQEPISVSIPASTCGHMMPSSAKQLRWVTITHEVAACTCAAPNEQHSRFCSYARQAHVSHNDDFKIQKNSSRCIEICYKLISPAFPLLFHHSLHRFWIISLANSPLSSHERSNRQLQSLCPMYR